MEHIIRELRGLTARVIAYRFQLENRRMANLIEIKGLGAAVQSAKKGIADVRSETSGLSSDAAALVSELQDVRAQIKQARDDIAFEAQTLGNGGGAPAPAPSAPSPQPSVAMATASQAAAAANPAISPETHTRDSAGSVIQK